MPSEPIIPELSSVPLARLWSLEGRTAVVTGGGAGIGAAISVRLAEAGARVIVADRDIAAADEMAARCGHGAVGVELDVTEPEAIAALVQRAVAEWGGVQIWVNNAGVYPPTGPIAGATDEHLRFVMDVNLGGVWSSSREVARVMGPGGVLLNIASTSGLRGGRGTAAYVASKHAVVGLTKSLAAELAESGIRVLAIAPENVDTPGARVQADALTSAGYASEPVGPFGRSATADDIARVALFLVSDLASWMTASTIPVDAGRLSRLAR